MENCPSVYQGLHISIIPRWELWSAALSGFLAIGEAGPSLWSCLAAMGSPRRGVPGMTWLAVGDASFLVVCWEGGASSVDLGRDLRRWLSRREPRVLSIHSQVRSMLWTSCMHWMYPVLYFCWASRANVGSERGRSYSNLWWWRRNIDSLDLLHFMLFTVITLLETDQSEHSKPIQPDYNQHFSGKSIHMYHCAETNVLCPHAAPCCPKPSMRFNAHQF